MIIKIKKWIKKKKEIANKFYSRILRKLESKIPKTKEFIYKKELILLEYINKENEKTSWKYGSKTKRVVAYLRKLRDVRMYIVITFTIIATYLISFRYDINLLYSFGIRKEKGITIDNLWWYVPINFSLIFIIIYLPILFLIVLYFKPTVEQEKRLAYIRVTYIDPIRFFIKNNGKNLQYFFIISPYPLLLIIIGASSKLVTPPDYIFLLNVDDELTHTISKIELSKNLLEINDDLLICKAKQSILIKYFYFTQVINYILYLFSTLLKFITSLYYFCKDYI